jgi:putative oxidoreductase
MHPIARTITLAQPLIRLLEVARPLFELGLRLYLANIFWKSGVNKLQSWDTTVALFENEYQVPVLSPYAAAVLGTGAELILPALLALGLTGRFAAFALFVFNIVAVISYPDLNEIGLKDHIYWGILLLVPLLYGPGRLALDGYLVRRWGSPAR